MGAPVLDPGNEQMHAAVDAERTCYSS